MRGDSDTEVLLEACALWGVEAAIERSIGMFAFALWDRETCTLVLARDRLGIKPLYYAAKPGRLLFASQLKAFRIVPRLGSDDRPGRRGRLSAPRLCRNSRARSIAKPRSCRPGTF